jgi:hypothetical protein
MLPDGCPAVATGRPRHSASQGRVFHTLWEELFDWHPVSFQGHPPLQISRTSQPRCMYLTVSIELGSCKTVTSLPSSQNLLIYWPSFHYYPSWLDKCLLPVSLHRFGLCPLCTVCEIWIYKKKCNYNVLA